MPDASTITIREASFSEGYLGWETWNAAIVFARWLSQNKALIENRRVIELGCGTSLAGIACAKNGAQHVALTDHNVPILKYAAQNAELNHCDSSVVSTSFLDWNDVRDGSEGGHGQQYDVVIGTGPTDQGRESGPVCCFSFLLLNWAASIV